MFECLGNINGPEISRRTAAIAAGLMLNAVAGCAMTPQDYQPQALGHEIYVQYDQLQQAELPVVSTQQANTESTITDVLGAIDYLTTPASTIPQAEITPTNQDSAPAERAQIFSELSTAEKGALITSSLTDELAAHFSEWDASKGFEQLVPGWEITYELRETQQTERRMYGLTYVHDKKIEIYLYSEPAIDQNEDTAHYTSVLGHELGHAVDVDRLNSDQRIAFAQTRGYGDTSYVWWPDNAASDFETGAGDFAEAFSDCIHPDGTNRSLLAGPADAEDCQIIETLIAVQ